MRVFTSAVYGQFPDVSAKHDPCNALGDGPSRVAKNSFT
jgi:hypothetical protein